jgi:hypothetical protein
LIAGEYESFKFERGTLECDSENESYDILKGAVSVPAVLRTMTYHGRKYEGERLLIVCAV